jgi:hypothetical protein
MVHKALSLSLFIAVMIEVILLTGRQGRGEYLKGERHGKQREKKLVYYGD